MPKKTRRYSYPTKPKWLGLTLILLAVYGMLFVNPQPGWFELGLLAAIADTVLLGVYFIAWRQRYA